MADVFKADAVLASRTSPPRLRVYFGDTCAGAFSAWLFDRREEATLIRHGDNQPGAALEFYVGASALPVEGQHLDGFVIGINGAVSSLKHQAGLYAVRINILQDDRNAVGSPALFQARLSEDGMARFWAYIALKF